MNAPTITVKDLAIPRFGFGTYGLDSRATESIKTALETGYRHLDTADVYGSHPNVAEAIKQSGVKRSEIFITTKIWKTDMAREAVKPAVERFLKELDTEYLDLLLIHRPSDVIPVADTLEAMHNLVEAGWLRSIGVSNFTLKEMQEVLETGIGIVNNQIEYHPSLQTDELVSFCKQQQISVTAYSPLGEGLDLNRPEVGKLAQSTNLTRAQVIIQWLLEKDLIVIPRSSNDAHIQENFEGYSKWLEQHGQVSKQDL